MEEKNPLKDYVWNTGNTFEIMRLLVEGAVTLYDDEASPLFRLGRLDGHSRGQWFDPDHLHFTGEIRT